MKRKKPLLGSLPRHHGWLDVRTDFLDIDGQEYPYDVVTIGDRVAVLPFIDDDTLLLSKQYRHPVQDTLLELVQGGIQAGEAIPEAARRELLEETGYTGTIKEIMTIYPLPGSLEMKLHLVEARRLRRKQEPEKNAIEEMQLVRVPYSQLLHDVMHGFHKDSALVIAVLHYAQRKGRIY